MVAVAQERVADLLDIAAIRTEKAERYLREFVKQAWHVVEPATPYQHNWHIDALCDHLQATLPPLPGYDPAAMQWPSSAIRNLLITMPPRAMKSLTVSVFFPAWAWIHFPEMRFLFASYAQTLSTEHSQLTRMVIESDWYQARWGDRFQLSEDDNLKTRFSNNRRGYRVATSVGASVTGFGGDFVITDDPHNVQQAESDAVRSDAVRWWTRAMSTRLNNPNTGVRIVVMQRVHENDVAGAVLESGEYTHLNLPMEYEPTDTVTPIGWRDPRTDPGELMWPSRYGPEAITRLKAELGSYAYASQFQQRPTPAEGGILKRHWLRFWQHAGMDLPPVEFDVDGRTVAHPLIDRPSLFDDELQSWDLSFKETRSGSYVVGLVGGVHGARLFLRDRFRDRTDFPGTITAFLRMTERWPDADIKLVEDKANGPALMSTLESRIPGIVAVSPDGTKEARMHAAAPFVEGGGLILPHPRIAPWVTEFIDEICTFPLAAHDDDADALSQMIRRVASHAVDFSDLDDYYAAVLGGRS